MKYTITCYQPTLHITGVEKEIAVLPDTQIRSLSYCGFKCLYVWINCVTLTYLPCLETAVDEAV